MIEKKIQDGIPIYNYEPDATKDELKCLNIDVTSDCKYHISDDCKQPFLIEADAEKYLQRIKLKDSGYSWIVLFALVLSNVLTAGYVKAFGIMYNNILLEYPETSEVMAGTLLALLAGSRSVLAPFASAVATAIGVRKAMTIGTTLCFLGVASSYFCNSVLQLAITLGAMAGCGFCLIETTQVIVIANYFDTKLSFANGIRVAGNPLGGMVYPFLLLYLFEAFGTRMMRIVLAGLFLNLMVCMALIRPPAVHRRIQILDSLKRVDKNRTSDHPELNNEEKYKIYLFMEKLLSADRKTQTKKRLEFHYLKNEVYWIFLLISICVSLSLPICIYYVPIYAREVGLTNYEISFLITFQSIMDLILRILMGCITNKKCCKKIHSFMMCLTIGGVGAAMIPFCTDLLGLLFTTSLFSVGSAGYFALISVVLIEQFGKNSIATTFGFVRMVQGIFNFINPPVIGAIIDSTGSFTAAFIVMGLGMLAAAGFLLVEPVVVKITRSNVVIT